MSAPANPGGGAGSRLSERRLGWRRARLIAAREFRERVGQKAYLIALVVGAVIAAAVVILPSVLGNDDRGSSSDASAKTVAVFVSGDPGTAQTELGYLKQAQTLVRGGAFTFEPASSAAAVRDAVRKSDRPLGLLISGDPSHPVATVIARQDGGGELSDQASQAVDQAAALARLKGSGGPASTLEPVKVGAEEVSGSGPSPETAAVVSVFGLLLYVGGLLLTTAYGTGIVTDRTNRVTERLLTAAKPFEHLAGKMVGVGASGLLQFAVWMAAAVLASVVGGHGTAFDDVPVRILLFFPVALVLTYVLFASVAAVLVLPVRKSEDVGSAVAPATILQIVGFSAATTIIAPGSTVSSFVHTLSLIPFFSPLLMLGRLAGGTVPAGELAIGILGPLVLAAILLRLVAPAYARYAIEAPGGKGLKTALALLRR